MPKQMAYFFDYVRFGLIVSNFFCMIFKLNQLYDLQIIKDFCQYIRSEVHCMLSDSLSVQNSSLGSTDHLVIKELQISCSLSIENTPNHIFNHQHNTSGSSYPDPIPTSTDSASLLEQSTVSNSQSQVQNLPTQGPQEQRFEQVQQPKPQTQTKQKESKLQLSTNETQIPLPQSIHDYKVIKFLGKGTFGHVYLVESLNKTQYAIKTFEDKTIDQQQKIRKQAKIMFSVEHPNVMDAKYFFPYNNQKSLGIVLQYCPDGDLRNFLGKLTPKKILQIQLEINKGLRYLHNKGIIHRDIKLENILMKNGKPKLSDLGLAQVMKVQDQASLWTRCVPRWLSGWVEGTRSYMSPEVFHGAKYSKQADIWSLGIVMLQLCTGKRITQLTTEKNEQQVKLKPAQIEGFPSNEILEQIKDLQMRAMVGGMLQRDASKRISLEDIEKKIEEKKIQDYNKLEDDLSVELPATSGQQLIELFKGNRKYPNIQKVCLVDNELDDKGLNAFAQNGDKFPVLHQVSINSKKITDNGLKQFTQNGDKFSTLKILRLGSEQITDAGLKVLLENGQNFPKLEFVVFSDNKITEAWKSKAREYQVNFQFFFHCSS